MSSAAGFCAFRFIARGPAAARNDLFLILYAAINGRSSTRNHFILCGHKWLLFHQRAQHEERSSPNRAPPHYTWKFFALQREEVVEERPFRAVKRNVFRTRALALVAPDPGPSQEMRRNKGTQTASLPNPPLPDCDECIHDASDSPLHHESGG